MTGEQVALFGDVTQNFHGGNPESVAAHDSIVPSKSELRARVVAQVVFAGDFGATCDEVEQATGYSHQTCSARFTEAVALGELIRTDRTRPTRSGRAARIHVGATA